jgi:hypothetical protein
MSLYQALSSRTSAILVAVNLCAWAGWLLTRAPYSDVQCARLNVQREAQDLATAHGEVRRDSIDGDHLLFGRPIHPGQAEPLHFRVLYGVNWLPLTGAWSFLVPTGSRALGPTCTESRICGVLFVILCALQWMIVGALGSIVIETMSGGRIRSA